MGLAERHRQPLLGRLILIEQNMPNVNGARERFIEDMGEHMVGWGLPRTTGRVYAYLLIHSRPASLDEIARDLGVAKSGVSVATRQLVSFGLARSSGERGSRRLLFTALRDPRAIFAARNALATDLIVLLHQGARVATTPSTRTHLTQMADGFTGFMREFADHLARAAARGGA